MESNKTLPKNFILNEEPAADWSVRGLAGSDKNTYAPGHMFWMSAAGLHAKDLDQLTGVVSV